MREDGENGSPYQKDSGVRPRSQMAPTAVDYGRDEKDFEARFPLSIVA